MSMSRWQKKTLMEWRWCYISQSTGVVTQTSGERSYTCTVEDGVWGVPVSSWAGLCSPLSHWITTLWLLKMNWKMNTLCVQLRILPLLFQESSGNILQLIDCGSWHYSFISTPSDWYCDRIINNEQTVKHKSQSFQFPEEITCLLLERWGPQGVVTLANPKTWHAVWHISCCSCNLLKAFHNYSNMNLSRKYC